MEEHVSPVIRRSLSNVNGDLKKAVRFGDHFLKILEFFVSHSDALINSLWNWVSLVSKGEYLVLYIVGNLIPLGFRISLLEGLKVSLKRVIALQRRVSVLGTLIFSDDIHHK